jgi:hypothetical protein
MRGTQFIKLVEMLRGELGRATSVSVGVADLPGLKLKLRARQEMLYDEYDWPFLQERFTRPLKASERYYDVPPGMNLERIEEAWVYYGLLPRKVDRIIDEKDYAYFNSDNGITADPVLKWDVRSTGDVTSENPNLEQIEVWPVPASNNQTMIWRGVRQLRPLVKDGDVCDLDDQIIVYLTAAELLEKQGNASAGTMKELASRRIGRIKGRQRGADRRYRMGMGNAIPDHPNKIVVRAS